MADAMELFGVTASATCVICQAPWRGSGPREAAI